MSELLMQFGASAAEGGWVLNRNEPIFLIEQLQLLQLMSKETSPKIGPSRCARFVFVSLCKSL